MLRGPNVVLRLLRAADIDTLTELTNDVAEIGEFGGLSFRTPSAMRKRFDEDGWWSEKEGVLLIVVDERIIGYIAFFEGFKHEEGFEVGYDIFREEDRGRGYGTEALRLFTAYLFEAKPIARLHVKTRSDNAASRRIAEKCGFVLEGTFRRFDFDRGHLRDALVLALLREDCPALDSVLAGSTGEGAS